MEDQSFRNMLRSGLPAGGAALLTFGGVGRQQITPNIPLRPSRLACGGFGAAFALGTFMMYDGDYRNGAGFTSVWSTLWLLSQRGKMFKGVYPASLGLLAAINAVGYALEFQSTPPSPAPAMSNLPPPSPA